MNSKFFKGKWKSVKSKFKSRWGKYSNLQLSDAKAQIVEILQNRFSRSTEE
jgi:hypothetical protein